MYGLKMLKGTGIVISPQKAREIAAALNASADEADAREAAKAEALAALDKVVRQLKAAFG